MRSLLLTLLLVPAVASAQSWDETKRTARAAAKTSADAVVDSARTIGETGKAMWHGGMPAARRAYEENASRTRRDVRQDAAETRAARH